MPRWWKNAIFDSGAMQKFALQTLISIHLEGNKTSVLLHLQKNCVREDKLDDAKKILQPLRAKYKEADALFNKLA